VHAQVVGLGFTCCNARNTNASVVCEIVNCLLTYFIVLFNHIGYMYILLIAFIHNQLLYVLQ